MPIPKRSEERRRRNKPERPIVKADAGLVEIPDAQEYWNPIIIRWFNALKQSGQSRFYEQSDWEMASVLAEVMSRGLEDGKLPPPAVLNLWRSGNLDLLATEAARRAAHVELQREGAENVSASADVIKAVFGGIAEPAS